MSQRTAETNAAHGQYVSGIFSKHNKKEIYMIIYIIIGRKNIAACIFALVLPADVPIPLKNNYGKYDIAAIAYRIKCTNGGNRYLHFPENYESGKYTEHSLFKSFLRRFFPKKRHLLRNPKSSRSFSGKKSCANDDSDYI